MVRLQREFRSISTTKSTNPRTGAITYSYKMGKVRKEQPSQSSVCNKVAAVQFLKKSSKVSFSGRALLAYPSEACSMSDGRRTFSKVI